MATREKINIEMYQGDRCKYQFIIFTDDEKTSLYDFSTATDAMMSVKTTLEEEEVLFSKTITDGENDSDFSEGSAIFILDKTQTALLTKTGKYDVQINFATYPVTVVYGDVMLQKQVGN